MEYLMHAAVPAVAFLLGAFINNMLKARKINALSGDLTSLQSKFYELQSGSKKQLSEKDIIIKKLRESTLNTLEKPSQKEELIELRAKNDSLSKDLQKVTASLKEFKIEKAVKKVDQKYPMVMFDPIEKKKAKNKKQDKQKKLKRATPNELLKSKKDKTSEDKPLKLKSKKSKKKTSSKSKRSKKLLDLLKEKKTSKKGKKKKKDKKKVK